MNREVVIDPELCEHNKPISKCRKCKKLDDAWQSLGEELHRMGSEEPEW